MSDSQEKKLAILNILDLQVKRLKAGKGPLKPCQFCGQSLTTDEDLEVTIKRKKETCVECDKRFKNGREPGEDDE